MPPTPSWAIGEPEDDQGTLRYWTTVGTVETIEAGLVEVDLGRSDWLSVVSHMFQEGVPRVLLLDHTLTVTEARDLAALLVQAADMAP
jgi:hypothetical protein